jgi:DNA-binding transcriptional ArsR family regulator
MTLVMISPVELRVDVPWVPTKERRLDGLTLRRGPNVLAFGDGVTLEVRLVDPTPLDSLKMLLEKVQAQGGPGRVVLVVGSVPIEWRGRLRSAGVSFLDVSGVAEIDWPRLRVSANRLDESVQRRTSPIPLQKSHALVVQELLIVARGSHAPTIGELARGAQVSQPSASRVVTQLADHGLVHKQRVGRKVAVRVTDPVELASRLAERTAWGRTDVIFAYRWGRNPWDVAARLSLDATKRGVRLAVSGRAGAAFLGVVGTSSPAVIRCWTDSLKVPLADIPAALGLEAAREEEANVAIATDPWRIGVHRSDTVKFDQWTATVSHPLRVWCDLHSEQRGTEFAAQMWGRINDG